MMKQYSIMVSDSEDVVSSALMKIMKQYKLSNMINQQVSLENLEFIINLFGVYGNEVSGTPLVAYGYNSKIFGVVFGGLLLPREDSTAFKIYSLFNSMMAYFENLKNNDIPSCDSLFINGLNSNIEKIILNSSLFGTAKTLDVVPGADDGKASGKSVWLCEKFPQRFYRRTRKIWVCIAGVVESSWIDSCSCCSNHRSHY